MFFSTFEEIVERFRLLKTKLKTNKETLIQKSREFKEISMDYESKHEYFSKSNTPTRLSKIVEEKYFSAKDKYLSEISSLGKEQKSILDSLDKIFKKSNIYHELSLYSDFIPEDKFCKLVVTLTKAHQNKEIGDEPLKKLKSYREIKFEKGSVYVKDNRVQYSDIILVNERNEILFLVRNKNDEFEPGKYCLPGGHVEPNENFKSAAVRECAEETGIELKLSDVVPCGNYIDSKCNIHYFTAKYTGDPVVLEEREQIQYEWVPIDKVGEKPLLMNLKQNLEEVINIPKCILNPENPSSDKYYFDGSTIVNEDDVELQKSLDKLCEDLNKGAIQVLEFDKALSEIEKSYEKYYIRKGAEFKAFVRLNNMSKSSSSEKVGTVMKEYKEGTLKTSSGKTVKDKDQAIAIALSEAGLSKSEDAEIKEWDGKRYKKVDNIWTPIDEEEEIQKALSTGKLIKKRKFITRGGKTFLTTVWVKPSGEVVKEEIKKEIPEDPRVSDLSVGDKVVLTTSRGDKGGTIAALVDTKEGICISLRTPTGKATEVYLKALKSVKRSTTPDVVEDIKPDTKLPDTSDKDIIKKIKSLGGSSEVSLVEIGDDKFVLKKERERDTGREQLKDEVLADKLYRLLGYYAPSSTLMEKDGSLYKISKFIEGREYGSLSGRDKEKAKGIIKKGFVMDCLLGNWDVLGASGDNILVVGSGDSMVVYRIDNGSALRHRARGGTKFPWAFLESTSVSEIDSMRTLDANPYAKEVFGSLTNEEIKSQIEYVYRNKENILSEVENSEIRKALENRLEWLNNYAKTIVVESKAKEETKKPEEKTRKPKGDMPSVVTEDYFEKGWSDFDFKANKGCKEALRERIIRFEKERQKGYEKCAKELGLTVEQYKAKLQDLAEKVFEKSKPFITIDGSEVLPLIFTKGGRFKSQFETGTSYGALSPYRRSGVEGDYFGFEDDPDVDKEKRPIYGYMTNNENGVISKDGRIPPTVGHYGNIYVEIKREKAISSATCTFGDSLGLSDEVPAIPFGKPHFTGFRGMDNPYKISDRLSKIEDYIKGKIFKLPEDIAGAYTELQYHNQLKLEDVECIHVSPEAFDFYDGDAYEQMSKAVNSLLKFSSETGSFIPVKMFVTKKD